MIPATLRITFWLVLLSIPIWAPRVWADEPLQPGSPIPADKCVIILGHGAEITATPMITEDGTLGATIEIVVGWASKANSSMVNGCRIENNKTNARIAFPPEGWREKQ